MIKAVTPVFEFVTPIYPFLPYRTSLHICMNCGYLYFKNHGNVKYCDTCKKIVKKHKGRQRVQKHIDKDRERYNELALERMVEYRNRWKILKKYRYEAIGKAYAEHENLMNQYHCGKGTGSLGLHRNSDFEQEYQLIQNEKKRIGIIKIGVSNTEL